jgi:hypothetical protein
VGSSEENSAAVVSNRVDGASEALNPENPPDEPEAPNPGESGPDVSAPEPEAVTEPEVPLEPEAVMDVEREPLPNEPSPEPEATPPEENEPIGGCGEQLLRNGTFDLGATVWSSSSTFPGIDVIVSSDSVALTQQGVLPFSGSHLAWLGGIPDNEWDHHFVLLEQQVFIPEGATGLTFSGWVWIRSEESEPAVAYDATFVDLTNLQGDVLWHPHEFTNLEQAEAWTAFEYSADEVPFSGRDVVLQIRSETDPTLVTSFWFDDLRLVAHCLR